MIAGPDALAVEAGARALSNGGNAIDAAVTCAFVQGVVNPANTGLGGYLVLTMQPGDGGPAVALDAPSPAGAGVTPAMWADRFVAPDASGWGFILRDQVNEFGYASICTPGAVPGLATILERWGTIGLADAVEQAAILAEGGYRVDDRVTANWHAPFQLSTPTTVLDYVRANAEASRIYLKPDGSSHRAGETIRNPDLARTLRRVAANGPSELATGETAVAIAADLAANGSFVTARDLGAYRVRDVEPLRGTYRGLQIQTSPSPHGGPTLLAILGILEGWDLAALGHNTPGYVLKIAMAMKAAFADRNRYLGDPAFVDDRSAWMISPDRLAYWRDRIERSEPIEAEPVAMSSGTTHVSIVDRHGTWVGLTHSLGGSSGVVTPGTGFMHNNSMANFHPLPGHPNSIAPGKGRTTGMAPTVVYRDGSPVLVLGASGATKIVTALAQVIVNVVDFGMSPQEAILAARFDCQGHAIRCHVRIPETVCAEVRRSHPIERLPTAYGGLGLVHAVGKLTGGGLGGGADAGAEGMALALTSGSDWA